LGDRLETATATLGPAHPATLRLTLARAEIDRAEGQGELAGGTRGTVLSLARENLPPRHPLRIELETNSLPVR
jgi:hypothetical protein